MSNFFNHQAIRSILGVFAAVLIGGIFVAAAAGPALASPLAAPVAASQVNVLHESNIVRGN
jgi:hypothetical protein